MIVTNVGRVAVDAGSADNERRESVRQKCVVLRGRRIPAKLGRIVPREYRHTSSAIVRLAAFAKASASRANS
jgi:hypothetical protein